MSWLDYLPVGRRGIYQMEERIMSAIDDLLNDVSDQLGKAKDEILAEIDSLEAALAENQPPSQDTIDRLRAAAQALDDVVPDVPSEPPVEPPVE